jgi:hypothetical protein
LRSTLLELCDGSIAFVPKNDEIRAATAAIELASLFAAARRRDADSPPPTEALANGIIPTVATHRGGLPISGMFVDQR